MVSPTKPKFDILLFGVTGFTGKLAAEYLLQRNYPDIQWAVSARNVEKAENCLKALVKDDDKANKRLPPILQADLVCTTPEQVEQLRQVVQQTKVVLTCSGPFEKYGKTLVQLCAELGVHYADITGETDFVRQMIAQHDSTARSTGAVLLNHCGNDCIPCDLILFEMNKVAQEKKCVLNKVMTYEEFSESAAFSGGTATTATFQLSKDRSAKADSFDPLLTTVEGTKSQFATKNVTPKKDVEVPSLPGKKAAPWIMGPVMVNCVKRSNALLGYAPSLQYGDVAVKHDSIGAWMKNTAFGATLGAAVAFPQVFSRFLPQPGEGPSREAMEQGHLTVHAVGSMVKDNNDKEGQEEEAITATFEFHKDTAYLYTAAFLVETGMLLVEKGASIRGGCHTPATALGSDLTQRLQQQLEAKLEVKVPASS